MNDTTENALIIRAELLIYKINIDIRIPKVWRFSDDLYLRVWSATEGTGAADAEGFLSLPNHYKVLISNSKRFN